MLNSQPLGIVNARRDTQEDAIEAAEDAKKDFVEIVTVGVGGLVSMPLLQTIASRPTLAFKAADFSASVNGLAKVVGDAMCRGGRRAITVFRAVALLIGYSHIACSGGD